MRAPTFDDLEPRRLFSGQPIVSIADLWVEEGNDGSKTAAVVVSLQIPAKQATTINYATQNGTALAGADYRAISGSLSFAKGETSKTIKVPLIGDRVPG